MINAAFSSRERRELALLLGDDYEVDHIGATQASSAFIEGKRQAIRVTQDVPDLSALNSRSSTTTSEGTWWPPSTPTALAR